MNPFLILFMSSLAVFRLAEFVSVDDGPFFVMKRIRSICKGHPQLCALLTCPYCVGSYVSIGAVIWLCSVHLIEAAHAPFWWAAIWGGQAVVLRTVRERV